MASVMVEVGLGMAALGLAGRAASRAMPQVAKQMEGLSARVAKVNWANAKYHRGGFEVQILTLVAGSFSPSHFDQNMRPDRL